ncbi:MAG: outer membrane protein assembly factor BamA, partial [Alphaproteobacteria bacterium]|nr:outer membrane protein assembly factor BamA [Alphaproteobacteria bacterium]
SAGFSSLERFLVNLSITQRNFMGKGQTLTAGVNYSSYSKSVELGFTEPYLFDRNIALGGSIYRRDYNSFNYIGNNRNDTYQQTTTGGQLRVGVPLTEYMSLQLRYGLNYDEVTLDRNLFFTNGVCDPLKAGRYLCDAIGNRLTSSVGYSLAYDTLNNRLRPSAGEQLSLSQDVAGLGGDVKYLRTRVSGAKYWGIGGSGFIFSTRAEGGYIHSFEDARTRGTDPIRLTDRFFLGEPQIRGFAIRGVGPRVQRFQVSLDGAGNIVRNTDKNSIVDDALGGRAYYVGHAELEIPLGSGGRELGLRPSIFVDAGAVFGLMDPLLNKPSKLCIATNGSVSPFPTGTGAACPAGTTAGLNSAFEEVYVGDSPKPRVSVGFGVNWNSPFGPFRIDIAKALVKVDGDDTKLITFNVGTAF